MDFSTVKEISIPEGSVKKIEIGGITVWEKKEATGGKYIFNVSYSGSTGSDGDVYLVYNTTSTNYGTEFPAGTKEFDSLPVYLSISAIPKNSNLWSVELIITVNGVTKYSKKSSSGRLDVNLLQYLDASKKNINIVVQRGKIDNIISGTIQGKCVITQS